MEIIFIEIELEYQRVILIIFQKELREIESVFLVCFEELIDIYKDLSVFEKLFLDDQLKNFKIRVNRI